MIGFNEGNIPPLKDITTRSSLKRPFSRAPNNTTYNQLNNIINVVQKVKHRNRSTTNNSRYPA